MWPKMERKCENVKTHFQTFNYIPAFWSMPFTELTDLHE